MKNYVIKTQNDISFHVYEKKIINKGSPTFLTISDLGCNHTQYDVFFKEKQMQNLISRFQWYHVELPGQTDRDEKVSHEEKYSKLDNSLKLDFPSIKSIADGIGELIKILELKQLVLFGEGIGANLLMRIAVEFDNLVLGGIFFQCPDKPSGPLQLFKEKVMKWRLNKDASDVKVDKFLLDHKFGHSFADKPSPILQTNIEKFEMRLKSQKIVSNSQVIALAQVYAQRPSLLELIPSLKCPILLIAGSLSVHANGTRSLYEEINRIQKKDNLETRIEYIEYSDIVSPMIENPDCLIRSIEFFLQGCGISIPKMNLVMEGKNKSSNRKMSMAELDMPKGLMSLQFKSAVLKE